MIIEHDENGRIFHKINDPIPSGIIESLLENNKTFLNFLPIQLYSEVEKEVHTQVPTDVEVEIQTEVPNEVTGEIDIITSIVTETVMETITTYETEMVEDGFEVTECNLVNDYIFNETITARPILTLPSSIDLDFDEEYTFDNLPDPCLISVDDIDQTITGGSLVISGTMSAVYKILFKQWPFMEKLVTVNILEPSSSDIVSTEDLMNKIKNL